jgi:hypothetical protein
MGQFGEDYRQHSGEHFMQTAISKIAIYVFGLLIYLAQAFGGGQTLPDHRRRVGWREI